MVHDEKVLRLGHLNITVADIKESAAFYRRWFGFDRVLANYPDGTRFVTDGNGFELALHQAEGPAQRGAADWHFGFLASDAQTVRELMSSMESAGLSVIDPDDETSYVGFKCLDPDSYVIEVAWEPRA